MGRLAGKTALITGASRGIGRAIAEAFAQEGADLVLTARNDALLAEVQAALAPAGVQVRTLAADLADPDATAAMFAAATEGKAIDVLVNNAGIYIGKAFTAYTLAEFDQLMRTNVYSVFQLMQLALLHMQARGSGSIVNVASTAGKWESPNQAAYNTTKHAVVGMTRCAALENAAAGIRVNAICPGMVETDMWQQFQVHADAQGIGLDELKTAALGRIPMGRFLQPEEVAHIAVYLGSEESRTMTGQTITISGGMRMG